MTKLITGGTGFIGSQLTGSTRLNSSEINLEDFNQTLNYFEANHFKEVVHCAAKISSALKMKENHHTYLIQNLIMDLNVLEAARRTGVQNLVTLGSISGLLPREDGYIDESCFSFGPSKNVNFGYNVEKYFQPFLLDAYQMDFNLNYKTVLLANCYGPGSVIEEDAPLVASIAFKVLQARERDTDVKLYGTGEDLRNLTFVGDIDAVITQHLQNLNSVDPVILASPYILKVREIAELIAKTLKYERTISFVDYSSQSKAVNKICRNDKLMALGYKIQWTPPDQGIFVMLKDYI